jgi:SAM-dependent methyltransferase
MEHDIRLEDIGWKVLQQRQVNLEKLTLQAIRRAHEAGGAVELLDLALGSGRHLMEILRSLPELNIRATLRDADQSNLEKGRQLANQLGITRVKFEIGDAFDEGQLKSLDPAPNVVMAAGLFELTPDSNRVRSTLDGLASGMQTGGYLVYTDQPHHPHLEMIGRVAVQREESPWAMRRRPLEEMDGLITDAGFVKAERLVDEHGLFTVGIAQLS